MQLYHLTRRGIPPPLLLTAPHPDPAAAAAIGADMADLDDTSLLPLPLLAPVGVADRPDRDIQAQQPQPLQPGQQPTQVWDLPPVNPLNPNRPHYRLHPRPSTIPQSPESADKWRVPTILVLTLTITLGVAMMFFLSWIAYRKIKQLRELRRREAIERQEMAMRI